MSKESIQRQMDGLRRIAVSKKLKKAGIKPSPEAIERIRKKLVWHRPGKAQNTVGFKKQELAIAEHLAGESQDQVERKYGFSNGYINVALKRYFPDRSQMDDILESSLLNNAVIANEVFVDKADQLTPKDAAISAGIFSQRYMEVRKARNTGFTETPPVSLVLQLERTLKKVEGKIIENEDSD